MAPGDPDILNDAAAISQRAGHLPAAAVWLQRAIACAPDKPALQHNLTVLHRMSGNLPAALASARDARAQSPTDAEAAFQLATTLARLGKFNEAAGLFREVVAALPEWFAAVTGLGSALQAEGDPIGAASVYRHYLARKPGHGAGWNNLGNALLNAVDPYAALAAFDVAVAADPDCAEIRYNRGLARLSVGDLAGGWEDHASRWQMASPPTPRQPFQNHLPRWDGEPLNGRHLLLHAEEGLGDTLQFMRFAAAAKQQGGPGRVTLLVQTPLRRLCALLVAQGAVDAVIDPTDAVPDADLCLPLMSLPKILAVSLSELANPVPYLDIPRRRPGGSRRRIGLVWAGNPLHPNDARRSMPTALLADLTDGIDADFISLQVGPAAAEHLSPSIATYATPRDFLDTAERVAGLDLLISVDTSVAHLAGAMGCPVWLMVPYVADWRWMNWRCDSPWYPTMRLFRQPQAGDWPGVCRAVRRALSDGNERQRAQAVLLGDP